MINAVVLVSGSGSNLQAFIDQSRDQNLPVSIRLVISNNIDAYGLERAKAADIPSKVINHTEYDSRLSFDHALMDAIDIHSPDIVILAGFMRILSAEFVEHYRDRLVNIHPSLLPKYPGTNTHQRAITAGDTWHGISVHFVVPEVDAGPVILQGKIKISSDDTPHSLQQRIHTIEHILYPLAVRWFAEGRLSIVDGKVLLDDELSEQQLQSFNV